MDGRDHNRRAVSAPVRVRLEMPEIRGKDNTFILLPDEGMDIPLCKIVLRAVPACK